MSTSASSAAPATDAIKYGTIPSGPVTLKAYDEETGRLSGEVTTANGAPFTFGFQRVSVQLVEGGDTKLRISIKPAKGPLGPVIEVDKGSNVPATIAVTKTHKLCAAAHFFMRDDVSTVEYTKVWAQLNKEPMFDSTCARMVAFHIYSEEEKKSKLVAVCDFANPTHKTATAAILGFRLAADAARFDVRHDGTFVTSPTAAERAARVATSNTPEGVAFAWSHTPPSVLLRGKIRESGSLFEGKSLGPMLTTLTKAELTSLEYDYKKKTSPATAPVPLASINRVGAEASGQVQYPASWQYPIPSEAMLPALWMLSDSQKKVMAFLDKLRSDSDDHKFFYQFAEKKAAGSVGAMLCACDSPALLSEPGYVSGWARALLSEKGKADVIAWRDHRHNLTNLQATLQAVIGKLYPPKDSGSDAEWEVLDLLFRVIKAFEMETVVDNGLHDAYLLLGNALGARVPGQLAAEEEYFGPVREASEKRARASAPEPTAPAAAAAVVPSTPPPPPTVAPKAKGRVVNRAGVPGSSPARPVDHVVVNGGGGSGPSPMKRPAAAAPVVESKYGGGGEEKKNGSPSKKRKMDSAAAAGTAAAAHAVSVGLGAAVELAETQSQHEDVPMGNVSSVAAAVTAMDVDSGTEPAATAAAVAPVAASAPCRPNERDELLSILANIRLERHAVDARLVEIKAALAQISSERKAAEKAMAESKTFMDMAMHTYRDARTQAENLTKLISTSGLAAGKALKDYHASASAIEATRSASLAEASLAFAAEVAKLVKMEDI